MTNAIRPAPLVGIISDPGLYPVPEDAEVVRVPTPYGDTASPIVLTSLAGRGVALLARQGERTLPPAMLPARANVWAFASLGAKAVISVTAAGGLRREYAPGTFAVPDQVVDRTWGRPTTFYDRGRLVQLSEPDLFDPQLRKLAVSALRGQKLPMRPTGTVAVVQGPRFNTRAESAWYAAAGADLVNMVLMPFAALAQELGMAVCNLSFVTHRDPAERSDETVTSALVERRMTDAAPIIRRVIWSMLLDLPEGFEPATSVPRDAIDEVLRREVVPGTAEHEQIASLRRQAGSTSSSDPRQVICDRVS